MGAEYTPIITEAELEERINTFPAKKLVELAAVAEL